MNITDAIRDLAQQAPGVPALIDGTRVLDRAVGAAVEGLATAGLARGDVVAVVPSTTPLLHVVVTLALARTGVAQLPLRADEPGARQRSLARSLRAGALPRNAIGKIDYPRVAQFIAAQARAGRGFRA